MSDATDYLSQWISIGQARLPSITRTTCQRSTGVGPPPNWKPGIVTYGYGINGSVTNDAQGNATGLLFGEVWVWASDRGQDLGGPPPLGQQFAEAEMDTETIRLEVVGDQVQLILKSVTWGFTVSAMATGLDGPSQQLLFSIPGAGPNAPQAVMIISLADTGQFGFL